MDCFQLILQLKEVKWTLSVHSVNLISAISVFPLEHQSYLSKGERLTLTNERAKGIRFKD